MRKKLVAILLLSMPLFAAEGTQWALEQSTLTYHVSHPLHDTVGLSHAARGKGICQAGECNFLIAVPVKSFDSGDSNRDLHMVQAVRGADFPMVTVRTKLPESDIGSRTIHADLQIELAGQTADYKQVPFQTSKEGSETRLTGTIPAKLSDFKIPPPSLLGVAVKNDMPIQVEMTWKPQ